MRSTIACSVVLAAALISATPASAGTVCYGSVEDPALGEVTASLDVNDKTGKPGELTLFWTPERAGGDGGAGYFGWPGLMLDYELDKSDTLIGPVAAEVLITQLSSYVGGKVDRAPPLSTVSVRVEGAGVKLLTWRDAEQREGQAKLAKLLRETRPAQLKVELLDPKGGSISWSVFEFSAMDKVARMAAEARGQAERSAAAFREAAGRGAAPKTC